MSAPSAAAGAVTELVPGSRAAFIESGSADVFVILEDGSRFPVATVVQGDAVLPAAAPVTLIVVVRQGSSIARADAPDEQAVSGFAAAASQRLGDPTLAGLDAVSLPAALATAVADAVSRRRDVRARQHEASMAHSSSLLTSVLSRIAFSSGRLRDPSANADHSSLVAVVTLIGMAEGFSVMAPSAKELTTSADPLRLIAHASGVRYRPAALTGNWERAGSSSYMGVLTSADGPPEPVALIHRRSKYMAQSASDPEPRPLDDATRAALAPNGYEFYAPLDGSRAITMSDVLRLGLHNSGSLWLIAAVMALGVALLGLLTPILTGWIISTVIPQGQTTLLAQAGLALILAAGLAFAFTLVQTFSVALISQRSTRTMQSAFWDRVLSLPAGFFRRYSTGDLAVRVLAVDSLQTLISVQVVSAILAAVFGLVNLFLMFSYSVSLGIAGVVFLLATTLVLYFGTKAVSHYATDTLHATRTANGLLVQILGGIAKIRLANAEERVEARYLDVARKQAVAMARQSVVIGRISAWFSFAASGATALFLTVVLLGWSDTGPSITTADYIAFMSSYGLAFAAIAGLSSLISPIANAGPTFDLLRPIMEELPETSGDRGDPGTLTGRIELRDVTFRYTPDGPLVLRGLNIDIEPGSMVALVGSSGAGKSTITRLLLGFEYPVDGQVLYDGRDLRDLDPTLVRRQMGVVVQEGTIVRGSVMTNILGSVSHDEDAAWEAARKAALADDVQAMPMKMQTIVDPTNVSGGQAQRILLARAIVNSPAILILDEATSALDNESQSRVTEAMTALDATRIVIAHRLSTIRSADRIIVMEAGVAVESGTFESLMAANGHFVALVHRQLA